MNITLMALIACIVAYFIGSIPFGLLVARARGINIREVGSGNIGATNITRNLGWKLGALVGVLDFTKSFLPALLARSLFTQDSLVMLVSIMPVLGHIFPIWLKFKGGKGVATIFGILGAYFGLPYFLAFLVFWFAIVKAVKLMSLVNLGVALLFPLAFWLKYHVIWFILFGVVLCGIIWVTHRANIGRLLKGEENPIQF
ncbi:MAG TPA: acyl-phosphate glycerol 3-phosphate acyltransferase [Anaerolineaceae bacterium]|jgi:glycerol-3-phosphate acyltransferase PlsY|nr:acyl-phosphate glycerol 3-phosphate acyltransferase [Anaerolineaceae bacterium]